MFAKYSRAGLALMAVPLYAGPILAGWSGATWVELFPFAALFFLMQLLRGIDEKRGQMGLGQFLILMAVAQIVVTALAFGLGALAAQLTGALPLNLWLPLGLTGFGAAIGVIRYKYDPQQDTMEALIDDVITQVEAAPDTPTDPLTPLRNLPESAKPQDLDPIVQSIEQDLGADGFFLFLPEIGLGQPQIDRGFLRYLASPAVRRDVAQNGALGAALSGLLDSSDAGVRYELVCILDTLLAEQAPQDALPPANILRHMAENWPELASLADQIDARFS